MWVLSGPPATTFNVLYNCKTCFSRWTTLKPASADPIKLDPGTPSHPCDLITNT